MRIDPQGYIGLFMPKTLRNGHDIHALIDWLAGHECDAERETSPRAYLIRAAKSAQAALNAFGEGGLQSTSPNSNASFGSLPAPSFVRSSKSTSK